MTDTTAAAQQQQAATPDTPTVVRERIPHEIVASVLAATTAFIGGTALHLPPWAIFIAWAGTFLLGGPNLVNAKKLWFAMPMGSTYALIIVQLETNWGTSFGDSQFARNCFAALCILVINTTLMYTGRIGLFALIPGMFFGFASYFATFFGGFGYDAGNPWSAWLCVIAMNALGPVYAWLSVRLAFPVKEGA
ncbi:DUF1097 domain-containing protein [Streptomyces sp. A7024]|uniref:DUF1097 domain-containing protein n=1 Tax=Streptomyces coryli TaxID=1128680 RepID=A0A6G4U4H1_9ACTN|nr:DUF1097 domain-containing protein [Streptomyces coryli]NGN67139.1 DUF1097 domain-containing protein [Streptomyces coryli]